MILYSYFRSSAAFRVRTALHLKGLSFEYRAVHLLKKGGEQYAPGYLALNPIGEVPCLVHQGRALAQSVAILSYLDELGASPRLFPGAPMDRARVLQFCENINAGIHPLQNLKVLKRLQSQWGAGEAETNQWAAHWIRRGFEGLEKFLEATAGTYCFGGQLTAADLFLVPQAFNAHRYGVSLTAFPHIRRIVTTCLGLDAFRKAHPYRQPDTPDDLKNAPLEF